MQTFANMKKKTTKKKVVAEETPATVAVLSPDTVKKIEAMSFKQVTTASRVDQLSKQIVGIESTVGKMAKVLDEQLSRILTPPSEGEYTVFHRRAFKKLSIRLRRKSIDLHVEDIDGSKRVYRCMNWTDLTYLIATQKIRDGIEEIVNAKSPDSGEKGKANE